MILNLKFLFDDVNICEGLLKVFDELLLRLEFVIIFCISIVIMFRVGCRFLILLVKYLILRVLKFV